MLIRDLSAQMCASRLLYSLKTKWSIAIATNLYSLRPSQNATRFNKYTSIQILYVCINNENKFKLSSIQRGSQSQRQNLSHQSNILNRYYNSLFLLCVRIPICSVFICSCALCLSYNQMYSEMRKMQTNCELWLVIYKLNTKYSRWIGIVWNYQRLTYTE